MKRIVSKERCEELLANWNSTHECEPVMDFITKYAGRKVDIILYDDNTVFAKIEDIEPDVYWVDNEFIEEVDG